MAYARNYKRTVRCSYCCQYGHNRSSCSSWKERVEELRENFGDDHYMVAREDSKKAKRKKSAKNRTCSYCDQSGHNRATCSGLKENIAKTKAKNAEFRKAVYDRLCQLGIGVGAIVSSDAHTRRVDENNFELDAEVYRVPQILTNINWSGINVWNREVWYFDSATHIDGDSPAPFFTVPMGLLSTRGWKNTIGFPFDKELLSLIMREDNLQDLIDGTHWRADRIGQHFLTVDSPVPPTAPPAGWLESEDNKVKELYKKRKEWQGAY